MNKSKLYFLLNEANIGIYNKCEIIEIFGFNKEKKEAFNIYTLIVFENTKQQNIKELLTDKLQKFKGYKNISWGIQRRIVDIETVFKLYKELLEKNKYQIDKPLNIGKMELLQEQYVPPIKDMNDEIQLNYILKNNFHNGSYILEFFDENKGSNQFLLDNRELLKILSEDINIIRPINIENIYDRLGNVVFQFPINGFKVSHNSIIKNNPRRYSGVTINITPKNKNFNLNNLAIRIFEYNEDNLIIRQRYEDVKKNITEIKLDDCFGTHIEIIDKSTSLLLYKYKFSIMKQAYISGNIVQQQKRVFKIDKKNHKVQVSHGMGNSIYGKEKNKAFNEWIQDRKYEQELKELEKSKAFVQYFGNEQKYIISEKFKFIIQNKKYKLKDYKLHKNQLVLISNAITKAVKDIRELINQYGERGVYIWDPYLSAIDIKNTLYFNKSTYVPSKAITGLGNQDKRHKREKFKQEMIEEFKKDSKQFLFLDLEVRGKIGKDGYKFHDRFVIFPLERPKVWSLGISVNQLGGSHHILQEVQNAQHILNAFNKLWDELDNEECLVWKSH